jgi:hypothetical protein
MSHPTPAEAEDRWNRFRRAARGRGGPRRLPLALATLLARSKWPGRVALLAISGLWDRSLSEGLGAAPGRIVDLADYVRAGPDPSLQPRALMDQAWYMAHTPGVVGSAWPPLAHYLIVGDRQGRDPHPLFDAAGYRGRLKGPGMLGLTSLGHYLAHGAAQGLNPHPLFDTLYYVGQCEAVARSGENPLIHYLREGWREGFDPHPLFDQTWYLSRDPAARTAGVAPLLHYVTQGAALGLDPHPLFDTAFYLRRRRGPLRGGDPLSDFLLVGAAEGANPTPHFDAGTYRQRAGEAARANPLLHLVRHGDPAEAMRAALAAPRASAEDDDQAIYRARTARHRAARPAAPPPPLVEPRPLVGVTGLKLVWLRPGEIAQANAEALVGRAGVVLLAEPGLTRITDLDSLTDAQAAAPAIVGATGQMIGARIGLDATPRPVPPGAAGLDVASGAIAISRALLGEVGGLDPGYVTAEGALSHLSLALRAHGVAIKARPSVILARDPQTQAEPLTLARDRQRLLAHWSEALEDINHIRVIALRPLSAPTSPGQRALARRYGLAETRAEPGPRATVITGQLSPGAFQADLEAAIEDGRREIYVTLDEGDILAPDARHGHAWLEAIAAATDMELFER